MSVKYDYNIYFMIKCEIHLSKRCLVRKKGLVTLRLLGVTGAGDLPVAGGHVDGARVAVVSTAVPEDRSLDYCSNFIIIYTQLNCTIYLPAKAQGSIAI